MRKLTYFKRYRMELDLREPPLRPALASSHLPYGFHWLPWNDFLRDTHAEVKALSFQDEMDALVFPCLGSLAGCRELMAAIRRRPGFCPHATWLVSSVDEFNDARSPAGGCVATIQGVVDESGFGGIQNVGVLPEFRGRGIGRALLSRALEGFRAVGARRAYLEATARNESAIRMYREMGFRCRKTLYLGVEVPERVGIQI